RWRGNRARHRLAAMRKDRSALFFDRLAAQRPEPEGELAYRNPYTLLVAVVRSAPGTAIGVNRATRPLFARVDNPAAMVALGEEGLKRYIRSIGLFNTKAKNGIRPSEILLAEHGGQVPHDRRTLETLPGVGRKT